MNEDDRTEPTVTGAEKRFVWGALTGVLLVVLVGAGLLALIAWGIWSAVS